MKKYLIAVTEHEGNNSKVKKFFLSIGDSPELALCNCNSDLESLFPEYKITNIKAQSNEVDKKSLIHMRSNLNISKSLELKVI